MSIDIEIDNINFVDKKANITTFPGGDVAITTGDATGTGTQLIVKKSGGATLGGKDLATKEYVDAAAGSGTYATQTYVDNSIQNATSDLAKKSELNAAVQNGTAGLASTGYVDQKVAGSTQGFATQQYVQDTIQSKVVQMFKDGQKLEQAGYQKLPNGFMMQWAIVTINPGQVFNWTYPAAFPNGVFCVFGNAIAGSTSNTADRTVQPVGPGLTSCSFSSTYNGGGMPGPTAHMVFAIGY